MALYRRRWSANNQGPFTGTPRPFPASYPGICAACGLPFFKGDSILLRGVKGQDGRPDGRGHAGGPAACSKAARVVRLVAESSGYRVLEKLGTIVKPDGTAVLGPVAVVLVSPGYRFTRVEVVEADETGRLFDGGLVEAVKAGGLKSPTEKESIFHGNRVSSCRECKGLLIPGDWVLWEKGKGSRHAVAERCAAGLWTSRKVKSFGEVWRGPGGVYYVSTWAGSHRYGWRRDFRTLTDSEVIQYGHLGEAVGGLDWVGRDLFDVEARVGLLGDIAADDEAGTKNGDFLKGGANGQ